MPAHRIFYSKEECLKQYQESKNLTEFKAKHTAAYRCCVENGWYDEICHSFFDWDKPKTFEEAIERVKHYKDRSALWKSDHRMFYFLEKKGWLNKIPNLISKTDENSKIHYVYAYEFPEYNTVYIGRTINIKQRHKQHLNKKCSVSNFLKEKKISFYDLKYPKILKSELTSSESQKLECEYIEQYHKNGWILLNKAKGGSIGSLSRKWTKKVCMELSKQFKTKKEFRETYKNAYFAAMEHHWLEEFTWLKKSKVKDKYTYDYCYDIAKNFTTNAEFRRKNKTIWWYSYDKGWLKSFDWLKVEKKNSPIIVYDCNGNFIEKSCDIIGYPRVVATRQSYYAKGNLYFQEDEIIKAYKEIPLKIDLNKFISEKTIKKIKKKLDI